MLFPKVLYNKNFLKIWIAQIFSQFGLNILNFVLLLKVYELTSSNTPVALLLLAFGVPGLILGYLAGAYVDNVDSRKVLVITNIVRAVVMLFLVLLPNHLTVYYLVAILVAVASQFFIPAEGSILPKLVPHEQLLSANSIFTSTLYSMTILGFLLAGPSLRLFNTSGTAFLILVSFVIALLMVWLLPVTGSRTLEVKSIQMFAKLWEGMRFLWKVKNVRDSLFFLTLTQTIFLLIASLAPGFLDKVLKIDVKEASLVLVAPAAIGLLLGAVILNRFSKKSSARFIVDLGILGMGLTLVLLTVVGTFLHPRAISVSATIILAIILGMGIAFINIPASTSIQTDTTESLRGRMYGLLVSLQSGVSVLPIILAGALADIFGVSFVLQVLGLAVFLLGVYRFRHKFL
jgi:MFS family permease